MATNKEDEKAATYTLEVATDRNGGRETFELNEIPYPVFKAARPHLTKEPDKAITIIMTNCASPESKERFLSKWAHSESIVFWVSLEDLFADILEPIAGSIKKN